jgi:dephospho-CoA kinase
MKRKRIALTGGIATGKSTVATIFARLGAVILDADQVARDAVLQGSPCWRKLWNFFGPAYFDTDGQLNRRKVRERIIHDANARSKVNSILHPAIMETMESQWEEYGRNSPDKTVIFDIPLLFESGLADRFDVTILVYAPPRTQIERLIQRDNLTPDEAVRTLTMQMGIEIKKELAQTVLDNSGSLEETERQVREIWNNLRSGSHA